MVKIAAIAKVGSSAGSEGARSNGSDLASLRSEGSFTLPGTSSEKKVEFFADLRTHSSLAKFEAMRKPEFRILPRNFAELLGFLRSPRAFVKKKLEIICRHRAACQFVQNGQYKAGEFSSLSKKYFNSVVLKAVGEWDLAAKNSVSLEAVVGDALKVEQKIVAGLGNFTEQSLMADMNYVHESIGHKANEFKGLSKMLWQHDTVLHSVSRATDRWHENLKNGHKVLLSNYLRKEVEPLQKFKMGLDNDQEIKEFHIKNANSAIDIVKNYGTTLQLEDASQHKNAWMKIVKEEGYAEAGLFSAYLEKSIVS